MALTSGRNTIELAEGGKRLVLPVAAGAVIYEGGMVAVDANGYAIPAKAAEGLKTAGRAEHRADNKDGKKGDITVEVHRGAFIWDNSANPDKLVTTEHLFEKCYIEDDHTVTADETGSSTAGRVIGITDEGVAVETW